MELPLVVNHRRQWYTITAEPLRCSEIITFTSLHCTDSLPLKYKFNVNENTKFYSSMPFLVQTWSFYKVLQDVF